MSFYVCFCRKCINIVVVVFFVSGRPEKSSITNSSGGSTSLVHVKTALNCSVWIWVAFRGHLIQFICRSDMFKGTRLSAVLVQSFGERAKQVFTAVHIPQMTERHEKSSRSYTMVVTMWGAGGVRQRELKGQQEGKTWTADFDPNQAGRWGRGCSSGLHQKQSRPERDCLVSTQGSLKG